MNGDPSTKRFPVIVLFLLMSCPSFAEAAISRQGAAIVKSEFIFDRGLPTAPFAHAPTIAETSSGFVVAWFGGTGEKNPDTKIFVSRTGRDFRNWTVPEVVAAGNDAKDPAAVWNPVLFRQKNGPLYLFYKIGETPENWKGMFKFSSDGGKTWGPPNRLPDGILGPAKNKPIELDDGTVLCPSSAQSPGERRIYIELIQPKSPGDLLLEDNWSRIGPLNDPSIQAIQPALLDLGQGKIRLFSRNRQPNPFLFQMILEASSADGGHTWSGLKPTRLSNPNSGIDATVLKDGRWVLAYNPSRIRRTPLEIAVSTNKGKTWTDRLRLDGGFGEYSYPSVIQAADGMIHVVYSWRRTKIKHAVIDPRRI